MTYAFQFAQAKSNLPPPLKFNGRQGRLAQNSGMRLVHVSHDRLMEVYGEQCLVAFDDQKWFNLSQNMDSNTRFGRPSPEFLAGISIFFEANDLGCSDNASASAFDVQKHLVVSVGDADANPEVRIGSPRTAVALPPFIDSHAPFTIKETGEIDGMFSLNCLQLFGFHEPTIHGGCLDIKEIL